MNFEKFKEILMKYSWEMGPVPEYISTNTIHDILTDGYDSFGKKIFRYKDVNYQTHYINGEDVVIFNLNNEGKYFVYLRYSKDEQENIAQIENIKRLDGRAYGEIQEKLNQKIKEIQSISEGIYDEKLERELTLVNTFSTINK